MVGVLLQALAAALVASTASVGEKGAFEAALHGKHTGGHAAVLKLEEDEEEGCGDIAEGHCCSAGEQGVAHVNRISGGRASVYLYQTDKTKWIDCPKLMPGKCPTQAKAAAMKNAAREKAKQAKKERDGLLAQARQGAKEKGDPRCDNVPQCQGRTKVACTVCLKQAEKSKILSCVGDRLSNTKAENALERIKTKCAGLSTEIQVKSPRNRSSVEWYDTMMCKHDQCVVKEVAQLFKDYVNIMDCMFGPSVTDACRVAPTAQFSAYGCGNGGCSGYRRPKCATVLKAYHGDCEAGSPAALKVHDGAQVVPIWFMNKQTPSEFEKESNEVDEECVSRYGSTNREAIIQNLEWEASRYIFLSIMRDGRAVCATIGEAGIYAYKKAGLLGRLDAVQEDYGGGSGHIFLMYSTRSAVNDVNKPCTEIYERHGYPRNMRTGDKGLCHAQFIDNWYAGLGMGLSIDDIVNNNNRAMHYSVFGAGADTNELEPHYIGKNSFNPRGWSFHADKCSGSNEYGRGTSVANARCPAGGLGWDW